MRLILSFSVFLICTNVTAETDARATVPDDFAYGISLEVDGDGALYRLRIPEPVYQAVTRSDLGDLRVFNSRSVAVPHLLMSPSSSPERPVSFSVPLFPLRDAAHAVGRFPRVHVVTDSQGAIIDVSSGVGIKKSESAITAYLLDLSALASTPGVLEFTWSEVTEPFATAIRMEASSDLKQWTQLPDTHVLAQLRFNGQLIQRKAAPVPATDAKYLRITWPAAREKGVTLRNATAVINKRDDKRRRNWTRVIGQVDKQVLGSEVLNFICDSRGVFPVDRIQVRLPHLNTLANAEIYSRRVKHRAWQSHYQGLLYRIGVLYTELVNDTVSLPAVAERHWKISLHKRQVTWSDGLPVCEFGWLPHELLFLAQGDAPFKLAYGSAVVSATKDQQVASLVEAKQGSPGFFIKHAQIGSPLVLGGASRLTMNKRVTGGFWMIPIVGVSIIVLLAYYLHKRVQQAKDRDEQP